MATNPFSALKYRALDANGNPLAGGKLYSYAAGTSTPLATYTTRAGDVANANPVILDANGEADVWLTAGVDYKFALYSSSDVLQETVDNYPSPAEEDLTGDVTTEPGGRLTLTTGTPVTTSDVTGATTVYYVPHKHNKVPLYDGSAWAVHSIPTELSQTTTDTTKSPAAVAANSNYDLFIWSDSGTLRLSRGPAWTSDTGRGTGAATTEIERVDGRYVNKVSISNGPAARCGLYVGTVRSDASSQINDSMTKRHAWNMYGRAFRPMRAFDATGSWVYNTGTWRQANNSSANQLDMVRGLDEDGVTSRVRAIVNSPTVAGPRAGVGVDSTTAFHSANVTHGFGDVAAAITVVGSDWVGLPGLGRHYLAWIEYGAAATTTFYGTASLAIGNQSGIQAEVWA